MRNSAAPNETGHARRVRFASVAAALPPHVVTSDAVEERLRRESPHVHFMPGLLEAMTGIRSRRYAEPGVVTSDLAAEAGRRALSCAGLAPDQIDLLIFAAAGQDLIEPATAHITQHKLGTRTPVMDVKNACNSFINAVQVAEALILTDQYRRVLVVTGEVLSLGIKWRIADKTDLRLSYPGYTFGDAGAAAVLEEARDGSGIFYRKFMAESAHWSIGTFPGGGTMHPRGDEHSYFRGDGALLKDAFLAVGPDFLQAALCESGACLDDFARIFVHQVSMPFLEILIRVTGIPREKIAVTLPNYGNMAAATLPVAFALALERGEVRRGDRVLFIGLAGGISLGILMFEF